MTHNAAGSTMAPKTPQIPLKTRNPNLLLVTKDITRFSAPRTNRPVSKTTAAGKTSARRPARSKKEAKTIEYDVTTQTTSDGLSPMS